MGLIRFFRGPREHYQPLTLHKDAIYFSINTKEILINNVAYGFNREGEGLLEDVSYENDQLTLHYSDNTTRIIKLDKVEVIDNLDSDNTQAALSANQGKVLKALIDSINVLKFQIVAELPETGKNGIIYLVPAEDEQEETNVYEEWVWIETENRYELIGSLGQIEVDDTLSEVSTNPVQNKIITEALNRLNKEVFPLTISVSGGGMFEKRTSQTITVSWTVKEGADVITPDTITVNDEPVTNTDRNKQFTNVTVNTTYTVKAVKDGITVTGSTSVTFVNPNYFGPVDSTFSATEENIKALTKIVKGSRSYTGNTTLNNQKVCYAYPKSFGALTSIKDANNFEYLSSYTRSEVNVWDETYYVYVLTDATTIDSFRQIYS